jgi:hypothetical protein
VSKARELMNGLNEASGDRFGGVFIFTVPHIRSFAVWEIELNGYGISASLKDPPPKPTFRRNVANSPIDVKTKVGSSPAPRKTYEFEEGVVVTEHNKGAQGFGFEVGEIWWKRGAKSMPPQVKKLVQLRVSDIIANEHTYDLIRRKRQLGIE